MFTNWLTYRATAASLDRALRGACIVSAFTQNRDELLLGLELRGSEQHLQCSLQQRLGHAILRPGFSRARKNSLDLLEGMVGERIAGVSIAATDRILRLEFESGRACLLYLFPVRGNIVYTDEHGSVLDTFKHGGPAVDATGLHFGHSWQGDPAQDLLAACDARTDVELRRVLSSIRPWMAGRFADEVLYRAGLPADALIDVCTGSTRDGLVQALQGCLEECGTCRGSVVVQAGEAVSCAPLKLTHLIAPPPTDDPGRPPAARSAEAPQDATSADAGEEEQFDDIQDALQYYLRRRYAGGAMRRMRDRVVSALRKERARCEASLGKLPSATELQSQADTMEKFGNLLMINLYETPQHPRRMTVPDVFTDPRLMIEVPLKEGRDVLANAQRYFGKAQQSRASVRYVEERRSMLEARMRRLVEFQSDVDAAKHTDELKTAYARNADLMEHMGFTNKGEKQDRPFPFRRFHVAGGFEVWAGKSSANNDELTMRYAKPNDIWLHARGVGGSHVVIKIGSAEGSPGKDSIREAAAIAAYYSKHRNAGSVPVAYTEKKYVRKPKGAPPGTVVLEREKVIMVKPSLPDAEE